jgi:hypothetical protein
MQPMLKLPWTQVLLCTFERTDASAGCRGREPGASYLVKKRGEYAEVRRRALLPEEGMKRRGDWKRTGRVLGSSVARFAFEFCSGTTSALFTFSPLKIGCSSGVPIRTAGSTSARHRRQRSVSARVWGFCRVCDNAIPDLHVL